MLKKYIINRITADKEKIINEIQIIIQDSIRNQIL